MCQGFVNLSLTRGKAVYLGKKKKKNSEKQFIQDMKKKKKKYPTKYLDSISSVALNCSHNSSVQYLC